MKFVILFFLFLAISYYIFLQRKKIVEGHDAGDSEAVKAGADLDDATSVLNSKEAELDKLLAEVDVLIEKEKKLNEAIKELEKEGGQEQSEGGEPKICDMTDCKTKNVTRKCTEFKKTAGIKCID